jgi:hypothetical protein
MWFPKRKTYSREIDSAGIGFVAFIVRVLVH